MQFIVKFFPEITIKSRPVRRQLIKQLRTNLRTLLKPLPAPVHVQSDWDRIVVDCDVDDPDIRADIVEVLSNTPGIAHFLDVVDYPFIDLQQAADKTRALWGDRLAGKTFAVRGKRAGEHDFNSHQMEVFIGGELNRHCNTGGVSLKHPDVTVRVEVRKNQLYVVNQRHPGLGGFPLGSPDAVLSLISGGFDSTVSSYLTMKRGMRTHFCFFNLGGRDHEIGVKEVALYLWMKFGASSPVKFVSVPFEGVVDEILKQVDNSHMGVILKRMMLRAGSQLAERVNARALVTGESVAQVASQTLVNLSIIDDVISTLVLRPLITMDKGDIIDVARQIGTEKFAAAMPEYCGVISVNPTTRAKLARVEHEESRFDFAVLDKAIVDARVLSIDEITQDELSRQDVEVLSVPLQDAIIIDVRHPAEEERQPLKLNSGISLEKIPFYDLHSGFETLDQSKTYLLYCDRGVMSKLHASYLLEQGYSNVKVYRPT